MGLQNVVIDMKKTGLRNLWVGMALLLLSTFGSTAFAQTCDQQWTLFSETCPAGIGATCVVKNGALTTTEFDLNHVNAIKSCDVLDQHLVDPSPHPTVPIDDLITNCLVEEMFLSDGTDVNCTSVIKITEATDDVLVTGDLQVDGQLDENQFIVQGHSIQTNALVVFEQSDGTDKFLVQNDGDVEAKGQIQIDGSEDENQFIVQGNAIQTNALAVLEQSDGTDQVIIENDGDIFSDGKIGLGGATAATAACVSNDGADRLFHDTNCNGVKDAGEDFLDAVAGGANTEVQFNNSGELDGSPEFIFDDATDLVTITGNLAVTGNSNSKQLIVTADVGQTSNPFEIEVPGGGDFNIEVDGDAFTTGVLGMGSESAAGSACIANDNVDRLFHDTDCDDTKDAGEEFIGLVGDVLLNAGIEFDGRDYGGTAVQPGEGIVLTNGVDCGDAIKNGQICWEDDQDLTVGDGVDTILINPGGIGVQSYSANDFPSSHSIIGTPRPASVISGSVNISVNTLAFDQTADECAGVVWSPDGPRDTDLTLFITIKAHAAAAPGAGQNVRWEVRNSVIPVGGDFDVAAVVEGSVTSGDWFTSARFSITTEISVLQSAWAFPTNNSAAVIYICRDANHVDDDLAQDALVTDVTIATFNIT